MVFYLNYNLKQIKIFIYYIMVDNNILNLCILEKYNIFILRNDIGIIYPSNEIGGNLEIIFLSS